MEIISGRIPAAIKVVIYGPEGIGKSTLASQFPEPLFIDTENSTTYMDVRRLPRPDSWLELLNEVDWVLANPASCQTLILDTADWAETLCIEHVCARDKKTGIEDYGYGKGYAFAVEEFGRLVNKLEQVKDKGINVVVAAHALISKFELPDELGSYNRWTLKLIDTPKCSNSAMLREWADAVFFVNYKTIIVNVDGQGAQKGKNKAQGGARVIYTTHHPCWDAKNRFGLADELPLEFESIAPILGEPAASATSTTASTIPTTTTTAPTTAPAAPAEPAPVAPSEPVPVAEPDPFEGIPAPLARLMQDAEVTPNEVKGVIATKGFFPYTTPWATIAAADGFLDGWLMHPNVWPQVVAAAKAERKKVPF